MIRKLFEQWLRPKTKQEIMNIKKRLAVLYAFVGWNCFAVCFYTLMKKEVPEDPETRRKSYSLLTGSGSKVNVYKMTGTSLTSSYTMEYDKEAIKLEKKNKWNKIETKEH
ncbi:hypothetical protein PUN28_017747 [Cardiocondyla obscurior]|uniref:Uncharacterized protein n=1 Tax=Cardiocondyla obscurior TaxID=286306 RepID=A0AAW2EMV6_9HYME